MTTWLIVGGVIAALLALVVWLARSSGKAKAQADYFEESHDQAKEAQKIDDAVARLSSDDLRDELRGDK